MPKTLPIDQFFETPREAWLLSIFGITLAPLMEELFFRGFLYPVLVRRMNILTAILLTGIAFGAIHGAQLMYSWGPVLVIVLVGIALTAVRAYTNSVGSTVLMHIGYNLTITVAMYYGTDGFRHLDKLKQ
jgi:membrane protease YdiL (CAAX protease family)